MNPDRSEANHFAGGLVLNAADDSARYSHDFDVFHEAVDDLVAASGKDVASLEAALGDLREDQDALGPVAGFPRIREIISTVSSRRRDGPAPSRSSC